MPQPVRDALRDSLVLWLASRLVVVLALVPGSNAWTIFPINWDAGYYRSIAALGYAGTNAAIHQPVAPAFFPGLPLIERAGHLLGGSYQSWGVVAASVTSLAAFVAIHLVTRERFGLRVARLSVAALAFFPFSFVFSTGYTEGPFLLFSVVAYAAALRGRALTAAGTAFLASGLRPTGLLLVPAFAWDAWRHPERRRAAIAGAVGAALAPLVYFLYLRHAVGDFYASLHAQQRGWHRSVSPLSAPHDLALYVLHAFTTPHGTSLVYLLAVPLCIAGLVVLWRHDVRDGAFVYALAGLLVPLSTGSATSLPRFAMATFPYVWAAGLGLAALARPWRVATLAASAACLAAAIAVSYHVQGPHALAP
jgi:hypothetical protein